MFIQSRNGFDHGFKVSIDVQVFICVTKIGLFLQRATHLFQVSRIPNGMDNFKTRIIELA